MTQKNIIRAPAHKSLYGASLDNPVTGKQALDVTRLEVEPGGRGGPPTSGISTAHPSGPTRNSSGPRRPTYSEMTRSGIPSVNTSTTNNVAHPITCPGVSPVKDRWEIVRSKKKKIPKTYSDSSSVTSSQSYRSSDRNFIPTQRPPLVKRNSLSKTSGQKPPAGRLKKPPGQAASEVVPHVLPRGPILDHLAKVGRGHLEVWWQVLGFTGQRGFVRREKFIQAIEALGFTSRNGDGSGVSYNPPAVFENKRALALHLTHKAKIEYTELKNKAGSIETQYPDMIRALYQLYKEL